MNKSCSLSGSIVSTSRARRAACLASALALVSAGQVHATPRTWDTTGNTTTDWATAANWGGTAPVSGDTLTFGLNGSASATLTNTLTNQTFVVGSITFSATAPAYTMTGNSYTLGTSTAGTVLTNSSANTQTLNNNIVLGNAIETIALTSGNITLGGNVTSTTTTGGSASAVTLTGGNTLTFSGGASDIEQTFTLANTAGETLALSNNATLTVGALAGGGATGGNVSIASGSTLTIGSIRNTSGSYAGVVSGAGNLATFGLTNTLTLTGANTYTGSTTIGSGTLNLGGAGANGSISSSSALVLGGTGGGTLAYTRTGTNAQTFNGTTINSGENAITESLSTQTINLGAITDNTGGTLDVSNTGTVTTSTTANTNGILGGFATFGGKTTWAVAPASSGGAITGLAAGGYTVYNTAANTFAPGATANVDFQVGNTTAATTQTINSLRYNTATTSTLTLASGQLLTIASGGILVTPTANVNNAISGGFVTGSAGGQLDVNLATGTMTISSQVEDNGGATSVVFSGPIGNILTLNNANNSYSGGTYYNGGKLGYANNGTPFGTGTLTFGDQTFSGSYGGISLGANTITSGLLSMALGNSTSNGNIGASGGLATWNLIGSGTSTFNGTIGTAATGSREIGFVLDSGTQIFGALSIAGTFNGINKLTVNGGTLQLGNGNSGTVTDETTVIALGGGTFVEMGNTAGAYSQTFTGGLQVNAGGSTLTINANSGTGTVLNPGAITRSVGGTVNFNLPSGTQSSTNGLVTSTGNTNGILGGYATVGNDWASNTTNAGGGNIIGLSSSTINSYTPYAAGATTFAPGATANVDVQASNSTAAVTQAVNSLRFNTSGANTLTTAASNTLTVTSGGILVTPTVGSNLTTITGGSISGPAVTGSSDLVVIQNNTSGGLTIGSLITNNTGTTSLTKSGAGLLTLTGANTYTGGLYLNGGTVNAATTNIDGSSTTNGIFFNGGTLQAAGALSTSKAVSLGANGGTVDLNGNGVTLGGVISSAAAGNNTGAGLLGAFDPTGDGLFTVTNSGSSAATLVLSNAANLYYGGLTINGNSTVQNAATSGTGALGAGFLTFGSGSSAPTVDLDGHSATVAGLIGTGTNGVITSSVSGTPTLTLDGTLSETYAGSIQNGSGTVALTINLNNATETQTLGGTNTYTGATSISSGILGLTGSLSGSSVTTSALGSVNESTTGSIAGSAVTFTQGSTGTSTFAGTNTYGGATAINSGVLQLANANAVENSTVSVNTNGGLAFGTGASTYNVGALSGASNVSLTNTSGGAITLSTGANGASTVYSGVLSGAGALTQAGSGTFTLSNANTFSGGTTASAGTIITQSATSLGTGNVSVATGAAVLNYNSTNNSGLTIAGTLNIATGGIIGDTVNSIGDINSGITVGTVTTTAGNYTIELIGTAASAANGVINGTQILATASAGSFLTGTPTLIILNNTGFTVGPIMATATQLSVNVSSGVTPTAEYWNGGLGGGFSTVWSASNGSSSNWVTSASGGATGLTPGATTTITFSANSPANLATSTTLGTNMSVLGIVVNDANGVGLADTYTLSIGTGGITVNSGAGATTLAVPIAMVGSQTWTNNSSNLLTVGSLGASISNSSAYNLATSGTGNITINGSIAGAGTLTQGGSGTLTLAGANTYSGTTTISSGTISISADNNLGTAPSSATPADLVINGTLATTANSFTLNANRGIAVGPSSGSGTGSINVASGTKVTYNGIIANNGTGTGTLATTGTGTLSLGGVNTYTGGTTIGAGGTLQTAVVGALGSTSNALTANGTLDMDGHNLTVGSLSGASTGTITSSVTGAVTLTNGGSANTTYGGLIQNGAATSVGLTQAGSGTLTLAGSSNSYTGATIVSAGVLSLSGSLGGNTAISTSGGGVFSETSAGSVSGATASLTLAGTGTSVLAGTNSYGGVTAIGNGTTLSLTGSLTGNTAISTAGTGVLSEGVTGGISGSTASVTTAGTGTSTLAGTNTYGGATAVNGGTLVAQGASAVSSTTAISINTGTLSVLNDGTGSNGTINLGNSVTGTTIATINVGNNGSGNIGNTVAFGALNNGTPGSASSTTFNFTGANGYQESFTSLALPGAGGQTTALNPTTTSVIILGNVTNSISTTTGGRYDTLILGGTSSGNAINGTISDSPGYAGVGAGDTRILMSGTGAWTLAGANTYHGTTGVSSGTLFLTGSLANTAISTSGAGVFSESSAGSITGTTTLTTVGTGTSVLAGTNSYTGATTVGAGTVLNVVNEVSLYNDVTASWNTSNIIVASGGTLDLNVGGAGQFTNADVAALAALGTASGGFESGSILGLDTTGGNFTLTALANPNSGANVLGLTKNGSNTLTLAGTESYTGTTTVNAGTLKVTGSGTIGAAAGNSALTVNTGGNVDLNGTSQNVDNLSGTGGAIFNNSGTGTSTLQIGSNNGTGGNFAGTIKDNNGAAGGIVALTKTGTGSITLSGANTYSGATSVNGGTLTLAGSLASGALNMAGGTFAYANPSGTGTQTFATTNLSGNSTINNTVVGDTLNLGALTRSAGGAIDFGTLTGTINTTTANSGATGMLGAWATTGSGTTLGYASSAGTGSAEGAITAYSGGTALPASGATEPNNYTLGNAGQTLTANEAGNTLQILNTDVSAITVGGAFNLTLNGILNSGGSGGGLTISTNTLTVGSSKELDIINNAESTTINSVIADANNGTVASSVVFASPGGGNLSLNGTNTYSGGTYIDSGTVSISNSAAFGTGTITFGAPGSSALVALVTGGQTIMNNITVNAGGIREFYTSGGNAYQINGLVTLVNGATLLAGDNGGSTFVFNGGFAGTGNVIFEYPVNNRASSGLISGADVNMVGTLTDGFGVLGASGGTGNLTVTANIDSNVTGLIANTTAGSFILSGTNTNSGPVSAVKGTLQFVNEVSLFNDQTGSWTANNIIVNSGATLALTVGGSGNFTSSDVVAIAALGTATGGLESGATLELDTTGGNFNLSTTLSNPNSGANVLNFAKAGSNTLTISAVQAYTGSTTLSAGTTVLGVTNAISSAIVSGGTTVLGVNNGIQSGGTLTMTNNSGNQITSNFDLAGFNQTLGALTFSTTAGANGNSVFNALANLGDSVGTGTLTLNGGASAVTFSSTAGNPLGALITANTVDLAGATQTFNVATSTFEPNGISVSSTIQNGALTKAGAGGLLLTGANTYTGATTISAGTLYIGTGGTAGSLAVGSSIVDNATLAFNRSNAVSEGTDFASGISSTGSVKQFGQGTLVLNGSTNTYTGGTTINSGTVQFAKTASMPATGAVVANNGGVLAVNAGGTGEFAATGSGAGTIAGIFAGTGGQGAAVTLSAGSAVGIDTTNAGGSLTYAGNITNTGVGVEKLGTGTLVLSGTGNTYTGATGVVAGTLQAGATNAFGTGSALSLANTAGVTLNLAGFNTAAASLSGGGTAGGNVTLGTATLTLANTANGGISSTYAGIISGTGGSLVESGVGTQVLSGANSYTGGTTINSGTLQFALTSAMPASGAVVVNSGGTLAVNAGGTGEFTGAATTGAGSIAGLFAGTGGRGAAVTLASGSAIGVDTTDNVGALTATTNLGGNAGLTKLGTGTLALTGTNTYAGTTTVNAGTLNLGNGTANGSLSGGGLTLGGGTFTYSRTGNVTQSFSGLTVNTGASTLSDTLATQTIVLNGITRNVGGTINFAPTTTSAITTTALNTNGILGGFATVGGTSWAVGSTSGSATTIAGLASASYTNTASATNNAATYNALTGAASNIDVTANTGTMTGTITVNSLRFNTAATETVTLATGTNTLSSGGILITSAVAGNGSIITGGTLVGASGTDLVVIDNATGTVSINSIIANNGSATGLTVSGSSTSLVSLGAVDTYTGTTTVNSGTLELAASASIANSAVIVNSGATLLFLVPGTESALVSSISGTGGINVNVNNQNSTVYLNLANTYTGTTTVSSRGIVVAQVATEYNAAGNPVSGAFGVNSALNMSGGAAATVNLNGFDNQVGSITGGTSQILLSGATLTTGGDNTSTLYSGSIIGAGGLTKIGTGTQQLAGPSTYTGQTIVNNGALEASGGTVSGLAGSGAFGVGSNVIVNANQTGSTASLILNNVTTAIGSLTLGGAGGTSTSTSNVSINSGDLILGGNVTFDATNNPFGSTISASTGFFQGYLELGGSRTFTVGSSSNSGGADLTISALIDDSTVPSSPGFAAGGYSLTKAGTGVLVLSSSLGNNYSGATNINAGTLSINLVAAAGTLQSLGVGSVVNMGSGSTADVLQYTGSTGTQSGFTINVLGTGTNTIKNSGTGTLTLADSIVKNGTTLTVTGAINIAGVISGSAPNSDMDYNNATSTISVAGTYTGPTHIFNNSTVTNGVNDALPDVNGGASGGNSTLIMGDSSETGTGKTNIYALGGYTQTLGGLTATQGTNADTNEVIGGSSTLSALTLTIASGTDTYSGFLGSGTVGSTNANNLALVSNGAGTLVLGAANTYTGGTTVSTGTLKLGATNALGTGGSLVVNSGGTVDLNGFSATVGALTLGSGGSTIAATSSGTLHTSGVTVNGTGNTINSGATVSGNTTQSANSALVVNGALTGTDSLAAGTTSLSGTGSVSGAVTMNGGGNSLSSSGTLATGGITVDNTGNTITAGTITGATTMASSSSLTVNSGASLSPVAGISQGSSSALTVNGSTGADSLATSATLTGTGSTGAVTLAGSNTLSSTGTLTTSSISVSGAGNVISAGTVAGNTTINSGGFLNVSSGATASGTVSISSGGSLGGMGTTGAVTLASGGAINLRDGAIGTLTVGGLSTSGGGSLSFDISGGGSTTVDRITDSGSLTISGVTTINIGNMGNVAQSLTNGTSTYELLSFGSGSAVLSDFNLATTSLDSKTLSLSLVGNNLYLNIVAPVSSTTYTLATSATSTLLHAGGSTTLTTTLTNTGSGTADAISYSGLGASTNLGSVSGSTLNSPPTLASGGNSVSNTGQTFSTTTGTSGTATISSTGTLTNATIGGTPSGTPTGTSITVYSGYGTWSTNGSGTWGTTPTATPANWTAAGGTPGVTTGFTGVDTATFGAQSTGAITVGLNGAAPNLNAITFSSPDTAYTLAQNVSGGTGTSSITLSGTTPSINVTNSGGSLTAGTQTISAPLILGATTSLNVAANQALNISGQISSSGTYGLSNSGPGATMLSNASGNIYTGTTSITGGTVYISNTTGSATGSGAVVVGNGSANSGVLAGNGFISTSAGVTVNGGGSLISGSRSQISGTSLATLGGMTMTDTALTVGSSVGTANLTFDLAAGNSGIGGGSAGFHTFANPNNNTTYLSLNGSSSINFAGATSISLVDLTNTNGHNGSLALLTGTPYLLIHAASNSEYLNLVINSGTDANPILSLSQNDTNATNGYVLGVWAGGSNPLSDYTAISIAQYGADGVTPLVAGPGGTYPAPALYLDAGNLEVVPEPGTWALMIGGLALLVAIQRRRNNS